MLITKWNIMIIILLKFKNYKNKTLFLIVKNINIYHSSDLFYFFSQEVLTFKIPFRLSQIPRQNLYYSKRF